MAVVLVGTLIAVYSTVRYDSSQNQSPQILTATDETDSAILKALGFTVGYYGSILQVTGNSTYAKANATAYMNSALQYISSMNPSWGATLNMTSLSLSTNWFTNSSISTGQISVFYSLAGLGIAGINYTTSCSLGVQIFNSPSNNQVCLNVTEDGTSPLLTLGAENFGFYSYAYSSMTWQKVYPSSTPTVFTNGTYLINIPNGVDPSAYVVQVTDARGLMVQAASFNSYRINFVAIGSLQSSPVTIELFQNGTMRWLGQNLQNSTLIRPIPPIPVKAFHLSPIGTTFDLPYQVEDWASQYQIPLGLTSNYTVFSNNQMIVFQISAAIPQVTLWWNGSDTAIQPSSGFIDTYFTADNPNNPTGGILTNGNITIKVSYPNSQFQITSNTTGGVTSVTKFMRVNALNSTYGSRAPAYVIHHGVVRDIIQEEAEWDNGSHLGIPGCPNVYSQTVLTLPANSTYFTYQGRLIFINSAFSRNITDLSPIQLTTNVTNPQVMTENGTSNGLPYVSNSSGVFYNYGFSNGTWTPHHWSQLINNSTRQGTGIMFTDAANQQLFFFDPMAGNITGGLYANASVPLIEIDPVTSRKTVSFASSLDITWSGAVATFTNQSPIYTNSGSPTGLWQLVEQPPVITETPANTNGASITLFPNIGAVGTSVAVSGSGFYPNSNITITFDGTNVATTVANASGFIPSGVMFNVPASAAGSSHAVTATDAFGDSASASFTVGPFMSLNPTAGNVGSTVTVAGLGFAANSTITLSFDGLDLMTSPTSIVSSGSGGFTATFTVPACVAGIHIVRGTDGADGFAATINVTSSIALSPQTGVIGSTVSVSGSGFAANSSIAIKFDGTNQSTSPAVVTTGSTGSFTATFVVPASAIGSHTVTSVDAGSNSASATFTVTSPSITLVPTSGLPSSSVTVSGSNFLPSSTVTLTFAGTSVSTSPNPIIVLGNGSFSASFTVPSSSPGGKTITATDSSSNSASATFTVLVSITINSSPAGSGFVIVDGNPITTPAAFNWAPGSAHSLQANSPVSGGIGKQYVYTGWSDGGAQAHSYTVPSSSATVTANYKTQWQVTFQQSGLGSDSSGTVLTVGTSTYSYSQLPQTNIWVDDGTTYSYNSPVPAGTGKQYVLTGVSGPTSPIYSSGTATGSYKTQYQVTFDASSNVKGDSSVTVVTVAGTGYNGVQLPYTSWYDSGSSLSYSYASPIASNSSPSNTQYVWNSTSGLGQTLQSNSFTVSTSGTMTGTYITQNKMTLSYSVTGGGSPTAPNFTANRNGVPTPQTLTTTATGYWFDAGSSWTITNPLGGSNGSERWYTNQTVSGTVSATTIAFTYYHQYQVSARYSTSDSSTPSASVILSGTQFGSSSYTLILATSAQTPWLDAGTSWSVNNPIPTSPATERWQAQTGTSGTVSLGTTVNPTYYHQYTVTPYYTVSDSSSPTVTGVVSFTQFGSVASATPTKGSSGGTAVWADAGSAVTYTSPIAGGSGERWKVASGDSGTHTAIASVSSSTTATVGYYHQYQVTPYYTLSDSSSPTITNVVGYTQFGSVASATPTKGSSGGTAVWADAGSAVTYTSPINGASGERWQVAPGDSGTHTAISLVSSSTTTATVEYYHQYSLTVTATPSGAVGGTFQVTYTQFGTANVNQPQATTWNSWADAATTATVSSPQSPYNGNTFSSYTNNPATMNSAQTITLNYQGGLDHFTFNTISSPQTAGTPFSITITAKDSSGNTVTSYTGTNTLSVSSGTISPTSTTAFVNGVWTGQVTLVTTGSGITIGTTGGSPVKSGTSNAITVNSGSGTLGNTNTGTSTQSLSNYLRGIPVTATVTGTIQSISAYLNVGSSFRHMKAALYSTSGTLIGTTNEVTGLSSGAQWVTMTFSGTKPTLTAGTTYILVVWADQGATSVSIYYSSTSSNAGRDQSLAYGTWPNPASFSNDSYLYCIYCTYSVP